MIAVRPNAVLIAEDEGIVSLMLEDVIREMGASAVDVFGEVAEALGAAATRHYDLAILDVMLRDGAVTPLADLLDSKGVPFLFSTAIGSEALEPRHRSRPILAKPFEDEVFKARIRDLLAPA